MPHDAGPRRSSRWRRGAHVAAAIALGIGAVGCDPTPPPTASPTAIPTAVASPSATPSPSPAAVTTEFLRIVAAPDFSATAAVSGTVTIAGTAGGITGDAVFAGPDASLAMTIALAGASRETASVSIGRQHWERHSPGPWLAKPDADPLTGSLSGMLAAIASVEDLGVVARDGRQLHHLRPQGGGTISPATIGFEVDGATDAVFSMDIYTADDGTPAVLGINGAWTQAQGDAAVPIGIDVAFAFEAVGAPQTVAPPVGVWTVSTSTTFPYSMAHPPDWTIESSKTEDAYAVDGQPYVYVAPQKLAKGVSVDEFSASLQDFYLDDFGKPTSVVARPLGGQPGYRLTYRFTNDRGQDVTFVDDITVRDRTGWEVFLVTAGGAEDIPIFDQFAATFRFTD
jgi:hypothetical protein